MVNQSQISQKTVEPEIDDLVDLREFTMDVLKGYDRREVDLMAINFCNTMIAEEPEDAKFWNWLKGRIKGRA